MIHDSITSSSMSSLFSSIPTCPSTSMPVPFTSQSPHPLTSPSSTLTCHLPSPIAPNAPPNGTSLRNPSHLLLVHKSTHHYPHYSLKPTTKFITSRPSRSHHLKDILHYVTKYRYKIGTYFEEKTKYNFSE